MGHIGVKGLHSAIEGIDFDDSTHQSCIICAKANIKRTPFPSRASIVLPVFLNVFIVISADPSLPATVPSDTSSSSFVVTLDTFLFPL